MNKHIYVTHGPLQMSIMIAA